VYELGLLKTVL